MAAIDRSKRTTLAKFLFAIGVLHVGEYVARLLASHFEGLSDLYRVPVERILEIKQIGTKIASSVALFFHDERNIETLEALISLGFQMENPDFVRGEDREAKLQGISFVVTGSLPIPRKEVEEMIEKQGGRVSSSVSSSTAYLVVGESPGSKLAKAKALGVRTISYDELIELINEERG